MGVLFVVLVPTDQTGVLCVAAGIVLVIGAVLSVLTEGAEGLGHTLG